VDWPFVGGWIGYFTYEAGLGTEGIQPTTRIEEATPPAWFRLYDSFAIHDHQEEKWYAAAVEWPLRLYFGQKTASARLANIRERFRRICDLRGVRDGCDPPQIPGADAPRISLSRPAYYNRVERAKRYIEGGDIYQVNLSRRYAVRSEADPLAVYRRLRRFTPSPYAAFLRHGRFAVLSASPELFLDLRDGHVVTRPIKGTRPRGTGRTDDQARWRELASSPKDRAELNMIVDLLRNDLSRVCSTGTVRVVDPGRIEKHPTVFHRVATIEGHLHSGLRWADLMKATFPGGSITGAPKIRAMQIIDELEPVARGVYCGSIGMIGLDGSMTLNIAIRTMVWSGAHFHFHSGGAIVADSTPEMEFEEIQAKAAGLLRALGAESSRVSKNRLGKRPSGTLRCPSHGIHAVDWPRGEIIPKRANPPRKPNGRKATPA
jgi:para-aminobenzoate synthetase component 1